MKADKGTFNFSSNESKMPKDTLKENDWLLGHFHFVNFHLTKQMLSSQIQMKEPIIWMQEEHKKKS